MAPRILGPYELERQLGAGGFGAVWAARHRQSGARHALKVIELTGPDDALRFQREAEALARLGPHPGLVAVHAAWNAGSTAVLAMELIEGQTLEAHLARGPLEPGAACRLVEQVARAVAHAHRRGVLHRDIKPANVLLGRAGQPRLVDLGLAAVSGGRSLTRTGEVLGTPAYVAPEQVTGAGCDARTDVFGLGALLHACLTGRAPRQGSPLALLAEAAQRPLPDLDALRPDLPAGLAAVVRRATALDPAERYAGADDLADALRGGATGPSARALRLTPWVALVFLLGAGGWWAARPGRAPAPLPAPLPAPQPAERPADEAPPGPVVLPLSEAAARNELRQALHRDVGARSAANDPAPQTRALLLAWRGAPTRTPPALVTRVLRQEIAERLPRERSWTAGHDVLLALDAYRYYLFDPTPTAGLLLPFTQRPVPLRWWQLLLAVRTGDFRVELRELREVDPALFEACPQSRILSAERADRLLRRRPRSDPQELLALLRRGLGLDPPGTLNDVAPGTDDAYVCRSLWAALAAGTRVRALCDGEEAARAALRPVWEELLGPGLARSRGFLPGEVRTLLNQVTFQREYGRLLADPSLVEEALALRQSVADMVPDEARARWALDNHADQLLIVELDPSRRGELVPLARAALRDLEERTWTSAADLADARQASVLLAHALLLDLPTDGSARAGQLAEVERHLARAAGAGSEQSADVTSYGLFGVTAVRASLAAGDREEALRRVERAISRAERELVWGTLPELVALRQSLERR